MASNNRLIRYASAFLAVGAGLLLRVWLTRLAGSGLPTYITFYPFIMFVAVLGGLGPGLLATVVAALVVDYYFLGPPKAFGVETLAEAIGLGFFLGMGTLMSVVAGLYRRSHGRRMQELRLANLRNRSLLETSLDPLVTISPEGIITDVNEATIKATGVSRAELIGTKFPSYFTDPEKAEEGYRRVFKEGFVRDYPLEIRHKNGAIISVLYNASVYRDEKNSVVGIFAAARDVTLLNKAEAELRRHRDSLEVLVKERTTDLELSNRRLARSNENLEQFAYVASHDLQEPLRTMASYSQLLEDRYKMKLDKDADEFIAFIVDAAKRMQRLITDLLAYSRIGTVEAETTDVDCNSILGKVIASIKSAIDETGAVITSNTLPNSLCNESDFVRLFQNLLSNAIKFRKADETPRIHISATKKDREWLFSISDNGIGIDEKYKEKIFVIFQRLHGRDKYPGTGIGLSMCKKIVEMHDGRIWVESQIGKGSTFYFTIPEQITIRRS